MPKQRASVWLLSLSQHRATTRQATTDDADDFDDALVWRCVTCVGRCVCILPVIESIVRSHTLAAMTENLVRTHNWY